MIRLPLYPALHTQSVTASLPGIACVLFGQLRQVSEVAAPVAVEYFPAPQSVHVEATDAPTVVEYFPAPQATHGPPPGPVNPRLQRQAEMAVCPVADVTVFAGQAVHVEAAMAPTAAEYVLRLQSMHAADPVAILYFPAMQAVQVPPLGPE
jgi:hypothetical protein